MSVRKTYSCDTCGTGLADTDGVGIVHKAGGEIWAVYMRNESAGRHLCNSCVKGLRAMLADLDRTQSIHAELDAAEAEARGVATASPAGSQPHRLADPINTEGK